MGVVRRTDADTTPTLALPLQGGKFLRVGVEAPANGDAVPALSVP